MNSKWPITQLGSKFDVPRKTVVPVDDTSVSYTCDDNDVDDTGVSYTW